MKKSFVYIKFPKTGLGNMLLTWSRAFVFAHLNGLPLVTSGWGKVQWGAWLRWEKKKRTYWGYFTESSRREKWNARIVKMSAEVIEEPEVKKITSPEKGTIFLFDQVSPLNDLFGPFRDHREQVRQAIFDMLAPAMKRRLDSYPAPVIAVHIRRGDFKLGNTLTPTSFFLKAIGLARETSGQQLPVTVFTDAAPGEIKEVLDLPGVTLAENKPDILDILLMSKSRIIVLSQSSTFSYWGAFLSEAVIIKPKGDWQADLRPDSVNKRLFEGKVDFEQENSIKKLTDGLKAYPW